MRKIELISRALPLQHPQQLPTLDGVLLMEVLERRVRSLVDQRAERHVVLGQVQDGAPDEHAVLGRVLAVAFEDGQQARHGQALRQRQLEGGRYIIRFIYNFFLVDIKQLLILVRLKFEIFFKFCKPTQF